MVVPVLDAPVCPDGTPEGLGIQPDLADVVPDLPAGAPQAGAGVLGPAKTRDAGGTGDRPLPPVREPGGDLEDLDAAVLLATMAAAVDRLVPANRIPLGTQPRDGLMQAGLVGLEPDQQGVAGARGAREAFFDSAARRR